MFRSRGRTTIVYGTMMMSIEGELDYELKLKNWGKEECEVVFEPPRLPSSEIIARMIERDKMHKVKGLKSFVDW